MGKRTMVLVMTAEGGALLERGERVLWDSHDDDDFRDEFGPEIIEHDDIDEVLEYLQDQGYIDSEQRESISIEEEYEEGDDAPAGDTVEGEIVE